jgi:hypothetical protein
MEAANKIDLVGIIDSTSLKVSTDSLDISFGEILSMYRDKELEIKPAYQRMFRWTLRQQSQLIESLLLGLPIPPIFVIETEDKKYELIDGLQRISTYFHFWGELENHEKFAKQKLVLQNCDIVKELNGVTIDELPHVLKIQLKRSYVKMYIIKKNSPPRIKYDMFKRLNTGGSQLEAQEIRNSTIRFLNQPFIDFIQQLSKTAHFSNTIKSVTPYNIDRQFDDELVLRFFTLKNAPIRKYSSENPGDTLADYMTKYAEELPTSFDYTNERFIFEETFKLINNSLGQEAYTSSENKTLFYAYYFEAISLSIAEKLEFFRAKQDKLKSALIALKEESLFKDYTTKKGKSRQTSGRKYLDFLDKRLKFTKKFLEDQCR